MIGMEQSPIVGGTLCNKGGYPFNFYIFLRILILKINIKKRLWRRRQR